MRPCRETHNSVDSFGHTCAGVDPAPVSARYVWLKSLIAQKAAQWACRLVASLIQVHGKACISMKRLE